MKNNHPSQPNLPSMTPHERKIWAASHNLPEDMLLVSVGEMMAMRESFDACLREVNHWRQLGKIYMGADLPESFEPALRAYMAERERLEREAKITTSTTLFEVPRSWTANPTKISSTVRPQEM